MITFSVTVERDVLDKYGDVSGTAKHGVKDCIEWPTNTSSVPLGARRQPSAKPSTPGKLTGMRGMDGSCFTVSRAEGA